jgi:glyoxylase I family protein
MDSPVSGFSHVQLHVADVAASEAWYTTVLGAERFYGEPAMEIVGLTHKPSRMVIVLSTAPAGSTPAEVTPASALDHLAFAVPDPASLHAWADHLTALGFAHDGVVPERANSSLQLRDPDGNAIELVARGHLAPT